MNNCEGLSSINPQFKYIFRRLIFICYPSINNDFEGGSFGNVVFLQVPLSHREHLPAFSSKTAIGTSIQLCFLFCPQGGCGPWRGWDHQGYGEGERNFEPFIKMYVILLYYW